MGKTPGKWIKSLLLGKKSSKKKDTMKSANKGDVLPSSEVPVSDVTVDSSLVSPQTSGSGAVNEVDAEKAVVCKPSDNGIILSTQQEDAEPQAVIDLCSHDKSEKDVHEKAATKVQAALRGYQARQAFRTLKILIRLQALIRGYLVRRQAISTLYCVKAIVKFQALARGYKVRHSDIGTAVHKICKVVRHQNSIGVIPSPQAQKLSKYVMVQKLSASSSTTITPSLNYSPDEPNSAWMWLDRWTRSGFWKPLPESCKDLSSISCGKNGSFQTVETDLGRKKKSSHKLPSSNVEKDSMQSSSDNAKSERPLRKISSCQVPGVQEHPQNETKKNKSKAKPSKVSHSTKDVPDKFEVADSKQKHSKRKVPNSSASTVVSEKGRSDSGGKVKSFAVEVPRQCDLKTSALVQDEDAQADELHSCPVIDINAAMDNGRDEGVQEMYQDLSCSYDPVNSDNQKTSQRRASLPAKFDCQENAVQNTPRLPSYMSPTESTKAKLRGQGSPRLIPDIVERNGVRRHSLSTSINGKSSLLSPRAERLVSLNGRGAVRTDRSLSSSRDFSEKGSQPEWRR